MNSDFLGLQPKPAYDGPRFTHRDQMPKWKTERAQQMRDKPTPAEHRLYEALKKPYGQRAETPRWRRQQCMFGYIADFWCAKAKLVVEVDGGYHGTEAQQRHDQLRDEALAAHGIRTLRFTNEQIANSLPDVLVAIKQAQAQAILKGA